MAWEIVQNASLALDPIEKKPLRRFHMEEIRALARWLASVNPDIPLHLSRFFPRYRMTDRPPTPVEEVYRLADEARA